jgi:dephospho-CoA kinase
MLRIGLTGGIGAGKSAVARALADHGAVVIDADQLAREVVEPGTPGLTRVVAEFGEEVLQPDGSLDRDWLGAIVFADAQRRERLNAIIHPLVRERTLARIDAAPTDSVVVQDIPLLVENGLAPQFALVIVVEAPGEVRLQRLIHDRGMTPDQAHARLAAQATDEQRRAVADVVIVNDATLADLARKADELWRRRLEPMAVNVREHRGAVPDGVVVVDSRPAWELDFERLAARVGAALGDRVIAVEHVGPTSVPGLPGLDVIDVLVLVRGASGAADADALKRVALIEQTDEVFWSADPGRPATVRLRSPTDVEGRNAILLRDHLRAHAAAAKEYGRVVREMANVVQGDRRLYTEVMTELDGSYRADAIAESCRNLDVPWDL